MSLESLLNRTCSIWELKTLAADGIGGFTRSEVDIAADYLAVKCRVRPASQSDQLQFSRRNLRADYVVYMLAAQDVNRENRIKLDGSEPPQQYLEVVSVVEPSVPGHHQKVFAFVQQRSAEDG